MSHWGVFQCETSDGGETVHVLPCDARGTPIDGHTISSQCQCKPTPDPDYDELLIHRDPQRAMH